MVSKRERVVRHGSEWPCCGSPACVVVRIGTVEVLTSLLSFAIRRCPPCAHPSARSRSPSHRGGPRHLGRLSLHDIRWIPSPAATYALRTVSSATRRSVALQSSYG